MFVKACGQDNLCILNMIPKGSHPTVRFVRNRKKNRLPIVDGSGIIYELT